MRRPASRDAPLRTNGVRNFRIRRGGSQAARHANVLDPSSGTNHFAGGQNAAVRSGGGDDFRSSAAASRAAGVNMKTKRI